MLGRGPVLPATLVSIITGPVYAHEVSQAEARCLRSAPAATAVNAIPAKCAETAGEATKSGLRASVNRRVTHQAMATIT